MSARRLDIGPRLALLLCLLAVAGCSQPTLSGEGMALGNQRYEAGDYVGAITHYEALVREGAHDGPLYYNLGNAYYKAGDIGRAILNYERARRLLPRDPDVATNLTLARAQTVDRLDAPEQGVLAAALRRLFSEMTTIAEAIVVTLAAWALLCTLTALLILWPRLRRALAIPLAIMGASAVLSALSVGAHLWDVRVRTPGIVVQDSVQVRSGPGSDYVLEFVLHAGASVRLMDVAEGWTRIGLPGDLQGWLPSDAVTAIVPNGAAAGADPRTGG